MHTVTLSVHDDIYSQLMLVIKSMGKIDIIEDKQSAANGIKESGFDFGQYQITAFNDVDPVSYQRTMRDEW
jgi:hypothetical protein